MFASIATRGSYNFLPFLITLSVFFLDGLQIKPIEQIIKRISPVPCFVLLPIPGYYRGKN